MRPVAIALFTSLVFAPCAEAGAWLREKGEGFAAFSISTTKNRDTSTSAYAEYGLRDTVTLGLDVSYGFELTGTEEGSGLVFLRFPIGRTDGTHLFAWHAGLGTRYLNREFYPAAELGASWGRGLKIKDYWGWANIDSSINTSQSPVDARVKLDGTLGLTLSDRFKVMAQVFNTFQDGDTFSKIAPSLLVIHGKTKLTWQFSAEIPAAGGGDTFFKIGLWRDF